MAKNLVIVESPTKAKTIKKFLGRNYEVIASEGHVRDLPKSSMGIDKDNDFEPHYITIRGKGELVSALRKAVKKSDFVYLATDPDREGEAISYHLSVTLKLDEKKYKRITFNEITQKAVKESLKNARAVDMKLVDAQQARRVVDRLVGYEISPLLWKKVSWGLSAGRVQSAALKLICDREREIEDFVPQEYWNIAADLTKEGLTPAQQKKNTFTAALAEYKGKKVKLTSKEETDKVLADLNKGSYSVKTLEPYETVKRPFAPYTTSTMQQDASIKLHFTPSKTMMLAQQLYQGVSVKGHGTTGLITYMRTDSVRISDEADRACKSFIRNTYGAGYVGNNYYTNKSSNTQDAHEAIRPSYMDLDPETVKDSLQNDQYKLYKLIWSRFVASRMKPAVYSGNAAEIANGDYILKAKGSALTFDGYLKVYSDNSKEKDKMLPPLAVGEPLKLVKLDGEQKFTQPPARFTEASLIKEMEENGIGRPSTYATIVNTLTEKRYVAKEKNALSPTDLGNKITYVIMEPYFKELVDVGFTADMEKQLDKVEEGDVRWQSVVGDYYNNYLKDELTKARAEVEKVVTVPEFIGENCPECGKPLVKKSGKFGSFIACSGYPDCRYTRNIIVGTGVACPKCGKEIIQKRSRKGKTFYGCSGYPDCDQVFWYKPVDKKCPKCGSLLVERGRKLVCSKEDCHYSENKQ